MKKEEVIKFYINFRLYIFPAVVALSSLFLIISVIFPQVVKLLENQKAIGELTNKSKFLDTKVVALESYNSEDLSRKVGFALSSLPADRDFGNILGLLQQAISQAGYTINSVSFGSATGKVGTSSSYEVKMEIKGSKITFQTLLNNLENLIRLVRVSSIDISTNQLTQALDIALVVEVLYSPIPQSFGSVDSPLPQISQKDEELLARLAVGANVIVSSPSATLGLPRGKSNPFE